MKIIHICSLIGDFTSGMTNIVPFYFESQRQTKNVYVGIINTQKKVSKELKEKVDFMDINEVGLNLDNLPDHLSNPDIVVFHGVYFPIYAIIAKKLRKNKIPYIIVPHGSLTKNAQAIKKIKKIIANKLFFNKFIKESSKIHYLSQEEKRQSENFKHENYIIANGINIPTKKLNRKKDGNINITYIGRYSIYHKGLDLLLESIRDAKNICKKSNIHVNLYGSGESEKEKLVALAKKYNISNILNIYGPVFNERKEHILLNSDFFIQLSRFEGQPVGILESMSYGIPIIVSDGTSFGQLAKKNKFGIRYTNPKEAFSEAVALYNNKEKYEKYSENARCFAKNNYSWKKIAEQNIAQYKIIVTKK